MFSADALLDALPIGICARDPEDRIIYVNPAMSELLGLPRELLVDKSLHEVLVEERGAAKPACFSGDLGLFRAPAVRRHVLMESTPVHSEDGELEFTIGLVCDPSTPVEALERDDRLLARRQQEVRLQEHLLSTGLPTLSSRQLEMAQLLSLGYAPKEIAALLGVSPHTVRNHAKLVFKKLRVHSQLELVRLFAATERAAWRSRKRPIREQE